MNKLTLIEKLKALQHATPEAASLLKDLFAPVFFKEGTSFPWHEQAAHYLYFIEEGLVRGYLYCKDEEHTCWIMDYGFLLPVNQSFTGAELEYTEFIRYSRGWVLNLEKALPLVQSQPVVCRMLFEIFQEHMQAGKIREMVLRLRSGDERFVFTQKQHRGLLDKIPHVVLASLLNVTPKYLYELKKKYR